MSEAQHSPLPWEVVHQLNTTGVFDVVAPRVHGGIVIATCGGSLDRDCVEGANAEFICRAVNAHEALVRSAQMVVDWFESRVPNFPENRLAIAGAARAALALAKGEK